MGSNGDYTAEQMIEAIQGSQGFVTTIAKKIGCPRSTVYRYIKNYATVAQAIQDERDKMKDFAEGQLFKNIQDGKETSLIFYLKTQAKDRGYVERQEVYNLDLSSLSDEQLEILANGGDPKSIISA